MKYIKLHLSASVELYCRNIQKESRFINLLQVKQGTDVRTEVEEVLGSFTEVKVVVQLTQLQVAQDSA